MLLSMGFTVFHSHEITFMSSSYDMLKYHIAIFPKTLDSHLFILEFGILVSVHVFDLRMQNYLNFSTLTTSLSISFSYLICVLTKHSYLLTSLDWICIWKCLTPDSSLISLSFYPTHIYWCHSAIFSLELTFISSLIASMALFLSGIFC
jgi:hypothetical protein